jgi:hypothetical protein
MQQLERAKIWKPCSKTHPAQTGKKKRKKHPRKKRKRIDPQINEQLKKMLMISKNAIPSGEKLCACKQGVHSSREMQRREELQSLLSSAMVMRSGDCLQP